MEHKLKSFYDKNKENIFFYSIFVLIYYQLISKIIIPFIKNNGLYTWDMSGLYFATWYQKEYLFPQAIGWNPYFFAGYAQNQFYSPLFSYIVSLISQVMQLEMAFKLVLVISIVLIPVSFYYFSKSYGFSKVKSSLTSLIMFSILFTFPNKSFGGDFYSTFKIGLILHIIGIMLIFFYLGSINNSIKTKKYALSALLLASIILTHIISAFAILLISLLLILNYLNEKEKLKVVIKSTILALLLSSFWLVPFIFKFSYSNSEQITTDAEYLLIAISGLISLIAGLIIKNKEKLPLLLFPLSIMILSIASKYIFNIPMHWYRFTILIFLIGVFSIMSLVKKDKILLYIILSILLISFIQFSPDTYASGPIKKDNTRPIEKELDGRVMIIAPPNKESSAHLFQHSIPIKNRVLAVKGLYVESAKNSEVLLNLEKEIEVDALHWGVYYYPGMTSNKTLIKEILPYQLDLFNINYIISYNQSYNNWKKLQRIISFNNFLIEQLKLELITYDLYEVGNSSLFEVLKYKPRYLKEEEWDKGVLNWFFSSEIKGGVLVNENVSNNVGNGFETINITYMSKNQDHIKINVNSSKEVPILIKISHYPNWNAYMGGKEIKIYKASPYLMLIYGKGDIELKYESTYSDKAGLILTLVGVLIIIYLFIESLNVQFLGRRKSF